MEQKDNILTYDNTIDSLYNLIITSSDYQKTFSDNLELWKNFYNDRFVIFDKNILNEKLFTIIKFLIEQEKGEIAPYFYDNIIRIIEMKQNQLVLRIRDSKNKSPQDIKKIFCNLKNHDELCEFLTTINIEDTFGSITKYSSKELELYSIDSLIITLHNQFFNLDSKLLKKTLEYISKKTLSLQKENVKNNMMNIDLTHQYLKLIIPIKEFLNEDIKEDYLIKQIINNQLKDKKILFKFFEILKPMLIVEIFHNDLNNLLKFLEDIDYLIDVDKQAILQRFLDKILEEDCSYALDLIVKDNQNKLWKTYSEEKYNGIITKALNEVPTMFTSDMIKYLLSCEYKINFDIKAYSNQTSILEFTLAKADFRHQCSYLLKKEEYLKTKNQFDILDVKEKLQIAIRNNNLKLNELTKEQIEINKNDELEVKEKKSIYHEMLGEDINFDTALELLNGYFNHLIMLHKHSMQTIIKSIAKEMLKQLEVQNNGIYFFESKNKYGFFETPDLIIGLNKKLINDFLDKKKPLNMRLAIFDTMFHEIKHASINQDRINYIWDIEAYEMEKEHIIRNFDTNFYEINYFKVKEEITARINGCDMTLKFIEIYFPQFLDEIQNQLIEDLEKEKNLAKEQNSSRTMQFLGNITEVFHSGFDTLIKYNPLLLKKYSIFHLEYYPNGIPKTYEDIIDSKNKENQELIDEILKIRYPEINSQELKTSYTR